MIRMVNLYGQYLSVKDEVDQAMRQVVRESAFIRGDQVRLLEEELAAFVGTDHCVTCGNGTDALLLALWALELGKGDEVIVPAFTFGAAAEAVALVGATPVFADVDPETFNMDPVSAGRLISERTRAILPVHLFGQPCDMRPILELARRHRLTVIEDNAQSFGAKCLDASDEWVCAGSVGWIGCTSFFPTKVLGCYGDGGALFTDDDELARKIRMLANHGQSTKYRYERLGINSRLDTLQAAVLRVKLRHLPEWINARIEVAGRYDAALKPFAALALPARTAGCTHVYHQYTLKVDPSLRDPLKAHLNRAGIEAMVYYPEPLYSQPAYASRSRRDPLMAVTPQLVGSVLSLPVCSHLAEEEQLRVVAAVERFMAG